MRSDALRAGQSHLRFGGVTNEERRVLDPLPAGYQLFALIGMIAQEHVKLEDALRIV